MLDFGAWGEFLIIAIAALILLGPKDVPKVLNVVGRWVYKTRLIIQDVKSYIDELAFQAQRDEIIGSSKKKEKLDEEESNDKKG